MRLTHILLLLLPVCYCGNLSAQNKATIIVKAGHTIRESVPATDLYEYPQFTPGTVIFKDDKQWSGNLNYNRFLDEMMFINPRGDTLALADEKNIRLVSIAKENFIYDKGYIKLVDGDEGIKLGVKQSLRIKDSKKAPVLGMSNSATGIDSYEGFDNGAHIYNLLVTQDLVLAKEVKYYIGDKYGQFAVASKRNLIEVFPKHQQAIVSYLKKNTVTFNSQEDLQKLLQFLKQSD